MSETECEKHSTRGKRCASKRSPGLTNHNKIFPLLAERGESWGEESNIAKPIHQGYPVASERRMNPETQASSEGAPQHERIQKAGGVTVAEKYLARLCEKNFLSLWSYPGLYRDQGKWGMKGTAKRSVTFW
jgi:hypothetical protein